MHNISEDIEKISKIDNKKPSIWLRLLDIKPLGFEPLPSLGFALAIVMIIGTSGASNTIYGSSEITITTADSGF